MGLLDGKTILGARVFNESSIAFTTAALAQREGAHVILTGFGKRKRLSEAVSKRLPHRAPVVDFDAAVQDDVDALHDRLTPFCDSLNGIVHCISASHPTVVGEHFPTATWEDVSHSFQVSAYSFQSLVRGCDQLLTTGASVVGCTLDASVAWPVYGWAGVAKAAYESVNQYLAIHLAQRNIRCNLVASGPINSYTMQAIDGIDTVNGMWEKRSPLPWDRRNSEPVAKTLVAVLSDWLPATTGEIIHADGGFHAVAY